jgi:hypothetical protein
MLLGAVIHRIKINPYINKKQIFYYKRFRQQETLKYQPKQSAPVFHKNPKISG